MAKLMNEESEWVHDTLLQNSGRPCGLYQAGEVTKVGLLTVNRSVSQDRSQNLETGCSTSEALDRGLWLLW